MDVFDWNYIFQVIQYNTFWIKNLTGVAIVFGKNTQKASYKCSVGNIINCSRSHDNLFIKNKHCHIYL